MTQNDENTIFCIFKAKTILWTFLLGKLAILGDRAYNTIRAYTAAF